MTVTTTVSYLARLTSTTMLSRGSLGMMAWTPRKIASCWVGDMVKYAQTVGKANPTQKTL